MIYFLMTPIRFLINLIQWVRRSLYRIGLMKSHSLPGYVVSVGNVELGGTGKTPLVVYLLEQLVEKGFRPVVLTRGYGSTLQSCDEPMLISIKEPSVPVVIGRKRKNAAEHFLNLMKDYKPTHWILDDGFQHLMLQRDFDICLVTGEFIKAPYWTRPFSREFLFAKDNSDLVLLTKSQEKNSKIESCDFSIDLLYKAESAEPLEHHKKITLFSGIAKPNFLIRQLSDLGFDVKHKLIVRDHASVSEDAFLELSKIGLPIVMTEKDYYRQRRFFSDSDFNIYLVRQKVQVSGSLFHDIYTNSNI